MTAIMLHQLLIEHPTAPERKQARTAWSTPRTCTRLCICHHQDKRL